MKIKTTFQPRSEPYNPRAVTSALALASGDVCFYPHRTATFESASRAQQLLAPVPQQGSKHPLPRAHTFPLSSDNDNWSGFW